MYGRFLLFFLLGSDWRLSPGKKRSKRTAKYFSQVPGQVEVLTPLQQEFGFSRLWRVPKEVGDFLQEGNKLNPLTHTTL
jgi:hypothetical protein